MDSVFILFIISIFFAYVYAFVSGFTDAANAIATSVGSRSLSPRTAIIMAGILETIGALAGTAVALTIGKGLVDASLISSLTVIAAVGATMLWSLLTYFYGIPVSETHGLIGGITGAALATAGADAVKWLGFKKIFIAIFASPILGFGAGLFLMIAIYLLFHSLNARTMNLIFKNLQRISAAFMAFSHGRNDAQKPMGIIVLALAAYSGTAVSKSGAAADSVPLWVILSVGLVAGLGVAYGGWRIIKTLGMKIADIGPAQGFAAETATAGVLQAASAFGIPVSTTHTITSAIIGSGSALRRSGVRWHIAVDIMISWILTLPATIAFGWLFYKLLKIVFN